MDPARLAEDHGKGGKGMTKYQLGKWAEKFFLDNEEWLVDTLPDIFRRANPDEKEEGADGIGVSTINGNANKEVKAITNFLTRDNDHGERTGTISFEIFQSWIPDHYENMYAGWLLSAYNPDTYNVIKREREQLHFQRTGEWHYLGSAKRPGRYAFILFDEREKPLASVVFEDVPKLLNRLRLLCPDTINWGIPNPRKLIPAADREYWNTWDSFPDKQKGKGYWDREHGGMIYNMWHIPLATLEDLATVTIIKPFQQYDPDSIAGRRYTHLQQLAQRRGKDNAVFNPQNKPARDEHLHALKLNPEQYQIVKDGTLIYGDNLKNLFDANPYILELCPELKEWENDKDYAVYAELEYIPKK